jgi:dihydrofolate reductase
MRKLIVTNIVSIDGYFEGPGGNVMAMNMDPAFDAYNRERLEAADTLVLGRSTFEMFQGFWPAVVDNPQASEDNRAISRRDNEIDKIVVSDVLTTDQLGAWKDTTRVISRADAHKQLAELKDGPGGDILIFGSHVLWNDLLAAGLVDEVHLMVGPAALGDGTPAFTAPVTLRRLDTRTWDGSDNVLVRYAAT